MSAVEEIDQLLASAQLHYSACGQGQLQWQHWDGADTRPLILLHGGFGSWTHWFANISGLRHHRSLWSLDMPGLGASSALPAPHAATRFAQTMLAGIDQLLGADAEFDLAGFSFGALLGSQLAMLAGERCKHFVAIGAAGCGDLHVQVELRLPPRSTAPWEEARLVHQHNLQALMLASPDRIDELALMIHSENLARARFNSRPLSRTDEFTRALPSIQARLCGIWGALDATAGGAQRIEARRQLLVEVQPGAGFHVLPGVGHWAMYESPERVNELLLAAVSN
jgi:2-hydroxy-6-oxonona-2,4-dienedioate hydrolase